MTIQYMIAYDGAEIDFTDDEFSKIENNDFLGMWAVFHKKTQYQFRKENENFEPKMNDLKKNGVIYIKNSLNLKELLNFREAWGEKLSKIRISKNADAPVLLDDESNENEYSVRNHSVKEEYHDEVYAFLDKVINDDITKIINDYFESNFSICYAIFSEAFPDLDPITSFRWHKDYGPECQTHMMIYLDDAAETGGRTEFINYDDSRRIDATGYDPNNLKDRVKNIQEILNDINVISPQPKIGDIVIFNATRIYHSGIHPTNKSRKAIILALQPDFLPWKKSVNRILFLKHPMGRNISQENPFHPYYLAV